MDANEIFNAGNCGFWLGVAIIIAWQGLTVGDTWPEQPRFMYGFVTLYGLTFVMVLFAGWHGPTWALLVLLTYGAWLLHVEERLTGGLWRRKGRENHRWTLRYFAAYLIAVLFLSHGYDVVTYILMLISLGTCGAVKVAREAWQNSRRAQELRRRRLPEDYRNGLHR